MPNQYTIREAPYLIEKVGSLISMNLSDIGGVYILCRHRWVEYVGQSDNVYARIMGHHAVTRADFTDAYYIPVKDRKQRDLVESILIHYYQPPKNGNTPHGGKSAPITEAYCPSITNIEEINNYVQPE
jgi:hypothetical protein